MAFFFSPNTFLGVGKMEFLGGKFRILSEMLLHVFTTINKRETFEK
jgi:hypothetical protein